MNYCKYILLILTSLFVYYYISDELKQKNLDSLHYHFNELINFIQNYPPDKLWIPVISLTLWIIC